MRKIVGKSHALWLIILVMVLSISACSPGQPMVTETPVVMTEDEPGSVTTEEPRTPTETPSAPDVLLVISPTAEGSLVSRLTDALESLVSERDLAFESVDGLSPDILTGTVQIVVAVGSDLSVAEAAGSHPEIQFVAIGDPQTAPAQNLSVIASGADDQVDRAFMAGYLAALVSNDHKVAALFPEDKTSVRVDAYLNGARFYCGICRPLYPPYNVFPYVQYLPAENASDGFQPVVDSLALYGVEVLYIPNSLATPELLSYLAELGVKVVGDQSPDMPRNNWVGTVMTDPVPALISLWDTLFTENSGSLFPTQITVSDTEAGLLSEGRKRLFDEIAEDLLAGLISVEPVP